MDGAIDYFYKSQLNSLNLSHYTSYYINIYVSIIIIHKKLIRYLQMIWQHVEMVNEVSYYNVVFIACT